MYTTKINYGSPRLGNKQLLTGFTLLELLLTVGILAVLGTAGFGIYQNLRTQVDIEEEQNRMAEVLRQAKANAIAIEQGYQWGVHFDNSNSNSPFYSLFAGPSYTGSNTTTQYFLSSSVAFVNPSAGAPSGTVALSWTNPADGDFSNVLILRDTAAVTATPTEGSSPNVNDPIGTSVVRYNGSAASFTDTGLTSGTPYYYKIFTKDTRGNYDTGTAAGPFTPN